MKNHFERFVSILELKTMIADVRAKLDRTNALNTKLDAFEREHLELARGNLTSALMQLEKVLNK